MRLEEIGTRYLTAKPAPNHSGWKPFVRSIRAQFNAMRSHGITVYRVYEPEVYRDCDAMFRDIRDHQRLFVSSVESLVPGHPLVARVDRWSGYTLNTAYRAVHDFYGHYRQGLDMSYRGEIEAYYAHLRSFPEVAWDVLYSELVGQLGMHALTGSFLPVAGFPSLRLSNLRFGNPAAEETLTFH